MGENGLTDVDLLALDYDAKVKMLERIVNELLAIRLEFASVSGRYAASRNTNEILAGASPEQVKWVLARLVCRTDQEAAQEIGFHPSTVSKWPNKAELDRAVGLLLREPVSAALTVLQEAAIEAAHVLVDSLRRKDKIRAADSILDRVGLRGPQEHKHSGNVTLGYSGNVDPDDDL
jgi:hypothetical protein